MSYQFDLISKDGTYLVQSLSWVFMDPPPGKSPYILFNVFPEPNDPQEYNILILSNGNLYGARRDEDYLVVAYGNPERVLLSNIIKIGDKETNLLKEDWMQKYCLPST
jgi:hypothetical protein